MLSSHFTQDQLYVYQESLLTKLLSFFFCFIPRFQLFEHVLCSGKFENAISPVSRSSHGISKEVFQSSFFLCCPVTQVLLVFEISKIQINILVSLHFSRSLFQFKKKTFLKVSFIIQADADHLQCSRDCHLIL